MKQYRTIKRSLDARAMLNIGCGARTHWQWNNMDFSPYARLAHRKYPTKMLHAVGILSSERYENIKRIDPDIIYWDIRKGLPFDNNVFDVIYHSHFIGHLDRDIAHYVTGECHRILKIGGIIRIVAPDLLQIVNLYNEAIKEMKESIHEAHKNHEHATKELFELMVRKDAFGTIRQNSIVRTIEFLIRGNIDSRGELRKWHYDKYSITILLQNAGFRDINATDASISKIGRWNEFGLDMNEDGSVYKPGSLYMEAIK